MNVKKQSKVSQRLGQVLTLLTFLAIVATAAVQRDGRLWGHRMGAAAADTAVAAPAGDTVSTLADGTLVVNTAPLAGDVKGYGGPVPLNIYVKDGRVARVVAQPNSETPDFFARASALLTRWNGLTPAQALAQKVDAVSGATFSSRAIVGNMQRGLQYAAHTSAVPDAGPALSWKTIAGLIVVLMGAIIPLFSHSRRYRTLQLVLNVAVLGLWGGTFLSWSLFVGYASSGVDFWLSLVPIVMLVTAFVYPLFGKRQYYCMQLCPFGSLQELAGRVGPRKLRLSPRTVKRLDNLRQALFAVLMVLMLTGVCSAWMDYELFTAFIFRSASAVVLVLAALFVVLAVFTPRPYCRFVCPTGSVFKML